MIWLALPALAAAAYYALAVVAAARWSRSSPPRGPASCPPVSILKPAHGRDPRFWGAIRSHAEQQYPEFEILFGVTDAADPSLVDIRRLEREYPNLRIRTHVVTTTAPNAKAGVLAELARQARYPVLLVNDSDIRVPPGYLAGVTAPLADPGVGLVTCLYRAAAESWPARAEALGIATEFAPSVLVARLLGVAEFALGSTMVFRSSTLAEIGGFEAIFDYLADDYQLGCRIHQRGYRIRFAPVVVETNLGGSGWAEVWRHQLRWSRTIRVSRPSGYFGYAVTHATLWAAVALAAGHWPIALLAMSLRLGAGVWTGAGILGDRKTAPDVWLIPLRDLAGFAVWLAGLSGNTVDWRGQKLRLLPDGRIRPKYPE
ncbi:MAG: bacteriohopanetetrol glucosamine biosynthesis glycosyltransferase HpnI [Bryobacteraceae bacterium]